jgi:hypothetical protein
VKPGLADFFKKWRTSGWLLMAFAILSVVPHCAPSLGGVFKSLLAPPDRVLIGIVDNKLQSKSGMHQVTKLKTPEGIVIEILGRADEDGQRKLLDRIVLPDLEDGYYHLNSRATNLAIVDIDADGEPEILAPTFDREGRPRLNAIKYNFASNRFLPLD